MGLKEELKKIAENCKECQENAVSKTKKTPVIPDDVAEMAVMERVSADVFHHGNDKYLTVVDRASGYIMCLDVRNKSTDSMVKTFTEIFNMFGTSPSTSPCSAISIVSLSACLGPPHI